jgi:hypothetical protein
MNRKCAATRRSYTTKGRRVSVVLDVAVGALAGLGHDSSMRVTLQE